MAEPLSSNTTSTKQQWIAEQARAALYLHQRKFTQCFEACTTRVMYMPAHIPQVLASPSGRRRLRGILVSKGSPTRAEIARRVCKAFKFFDARGALRLSSCRAALTTLARKGVISLPASLSPRRAPARPRSLDRPVRAAREVPNRVDQIAWLRLLRVTTAPQQRVWNRLMQDEHAQVLFLRISRPK